jgi:hypothetical protein
MHHSCLFPLSLEEERAEALREITEAFGSLRNPAKRIIDATATVVVDETVDVLVAPPQAITVPVAWSRRPMMATPTSRGSRY